MRFNAVIGMRSFGFLVALTILLMNPANSQDYPSKPIRLITPNSSGSSVDLVARKFAEKLGHELGQAVYVENITGAGGVLGTEALLGAPSDGYTISVVSSNAAIFPHLYQNLKFDAVKDLGSIATIATAPMVLVARTDFPANDASQLSALAKVKANAITMASSGVGTVLHLAGELMQSTGGFKLLHVPYKGVAPVLPDLVAGTVDVALMGIPSVEGLVKQGRLKILGISGSSTNVSVPSAKPIANSIPGYNFESWYMILGSANLPPSVVQKSTRRRTGLWAIKISHRPL